MNKIKTLFLAANPKQTNQLALDEEIREITQKIRMSEGRDLLDVISSWAVRPDDLLQYLNEYKPQIVHFSGHGSSNGELILVDNIGNAKPVSPEALKALFITLKDNIQIVILNACYSRIQGEAINEVIDYVVGMNKAIGDEAAIVFAASFYRALGFNRTVQEAFDQAKTALLLEGISEEKTPELLVKTGVSSSRKLTSAELMRESNIWLANKLMEKGLDGNKEIREQWDRVANYFDSIADTLERMVVSFKKQEIPRIDGNSLKVLIAEFTGIVHSIYSPDEDNDREKSYKLLAELYRTAEAATDEDIQHLAIGYFGDNTIHGSSADRIAQIERVAGKYRGLAITLRAKNPSA